MNEDDLKYIIEATLLAAGRPVTSTQLLELFDERERPTQEQLLAACQALSADYESRGIELVEVASGWRIQVRPRCADVVSRLWQERPSRYSRALLETLALIAYRQPITRSEIEEIRGVSISSTIMRTLQERSWIRTVGHREVPGRPELLGTTREFLDYFGLKSLEQLPTLAELRDVETIGVQLELPASETSADADAIDAEAAPGEATHDGNPALAGRSDELSSAKATHQGTDIVTDVASSAGDASPDAVDEMAVHAESSDEFVVGDEGSDALPCETERSDAPGSEDQDDETYVLSMVETQDTQGVSAGERTDSPALESADARAPASAADAAAVRESIDEDDEGADDEDEEANSSSNESSTLVAGSDAGSMIGGSVIGDPPQEY